MKRFTLLVLFALIALAIVASGERGAQREAAPGPCGWTPLTGEDRVYSEHAQSLKDVYPNLLDEKGK